MRVRAKNFKSIGELELELAPLTILVGPPGGGKSNILDAIALAGYFAEVAQGRLRYADPCALARCSAGLSCIYPHEGAVAAVELEGSRGRVQVAVLQHGWVEVNGVRVREPYDAYAGALRSALPERIGARVYGYDRRFVRHMLCSGGALGLLKKELHSILEDVNELLADAGVELRVLRSGAVALFDRGREVDPASAPESALRLLYYLAALRDAEDYAEATGAEYVVGLESPDSGIAPMFYSTLIRYALRASNCAYVVMEVHSSLFVSMLWDKAKEAKTYYVARDGEGLTRAWELDVEKLARGLVTAEDLFYMRPQEVVGRYTA